MWMLAQAAQTTNDTQTTNEVATTNVVEQLDKVVAPGGEVNWLALQEFALSILPPAVTVILLLIVAYFLALWASRATEKALIKSRIEATLAKFFGKLVKTAIIVIAVVMCLGKFGVSTASLAAVIAAAGFAVGLAFQGSLSNFSSGVMLLVFRPFKVGDVVTVAGLTAKVFEIDLFTTTLDTPDNRRMIVPNSSIFGTTIENITFHPHRRVDVPVGVTYSANIAQTRAALMEAAMKVEGRLDDPAPAVFLSDLGDSSVNWSVRVWATTANFWDVKERLVEQVKVTLDEKGLEIPFPQMDVHLDKPGE
jgi:small conductance mechanosensitive channel